MMKIYRVHYREACVNKDKTIGYYTTEEKAKKIAMNTWVSWDDERTEEKENKKKNKKKKKKIKKYFISILIYTIIIFSLFACVNK